MYPTAFSLMKAITVNLHPLGKNLKSKAELEEESQVHP